jgi:hypothetical protein
MLGWATRPSNKHFCVCLIRRSATKRGAPSFAYFAKGGKTLFTVRGYFSNNPQPYSHAGDGSSYPTLDQKRVKDGAPTVCGWVRLIKLGWATRPSNKHFCVYLIRRSATKRGAPSFAYFAKGGKTLFTVRGYFSNNPQPYSHAGDGSCYPTLDQKRVKDGAPTVCG